MDKTDHNRILIVGGGPVGTIAALALVRQGIPVSLYEAQEVPPRDPRAATTHPPTLEMLDQIGLGVDVRKLGLKAPEFQFRDRQTNEIIATFDMSILADETDYPFCVQCEQWKIAGLALEALEKYDIADVNMGTKVVAVAQDADKASLTYEHANGDQNQVLGRYLIGCDGGRSMVRKSLDINFAGFTYPERFLVMAMEHDFAKSGGFIYRSYVMDPVEWCAVFKVPHEGPPGLWRTLFPTDPEHSDDYVLSDEAVDERIKRLEPSLSCNDTVHRNLYMVHQRVAEKFRSGRCFLAGDAAHVNNPLGGLGLNSGIHDVMNLTAKISDVWHGRADEAVFDRYDRQRQSMAEEYVQAQTIANKKRLEATDESVRARNMEELHENAKDPVKAKAWLMRASLLESVRRAEEIV